jgi:hypothetical protein
VGRGVTLDSVILPQFLETANQFRGDPATKLPAIGEVRDYLASSQTQPIRPAETEHMSAHRKIS